jgi:hypothetical protein
MRCERVKPKGSSTGVVREVGLGQELSGFDRIPDIDDGLVVDEGLPGIREVVVQLVLVCRPVRVLDRDLVRRDLRHAAVLLGTYCT